MVGFNTSAADKQRLEASVRRAIRLGLYIDPTPSQLAADWDDNLFANILHNPHHVLHKFLPRTKPLIPTILDLRAAVSVLIGPRCPALLESYSCKCAYCCIIGQIKWWWWWWWSRRHSLSLTVKTDCTNFLNRLLFKDFYQLFITCHGCVLSTVFIKEMMMLLIMNVE